MNRIIKHALIGLGCYIIPTAALYGYHAYSLPIFLILSSIVCYFLFRNEKEEKRVQRGLIEVYLPFLLLIFITSLFTNGVRFILPYLIFTPLISFLVYYWVISRRNVVFPVVILIFAVISLFSFNAISGSEEVFDNSYLEIYRRIGSK